MKLYPRGTQSSLAYGDKEYTIEPGGYVEVPDEDIAELLHSHGGAGSIWETEGERSVRVVSEEAERRNSPGAIYDLLASRMPAPEVSSAERLQQIRAQEAELAAEADALEAAETRKVEEAAARDKAAAAKKKEADEKAAAEKEAEAKKEAAAKEKSDAAAAKAAAAKK
jgi:hypothetical protein